MTLSQNEGVALVERVRLAVDNGRLRRLARRQIERTQRRVRDGLLNQREELSLLETNVRL